MPLQIPNEEHFRKLLEIEAVAQGCRYTQIPDVHRAAYSIAKKAGAQLPVYPRPCDGIFECVLGMAWIELKIGNNKLLPHQYAHLLRAHELHGKAYVIRAKETVKAGLVYTIEKMDLTVIEARTLPELIEKLMKELI
jgi:hypothetical protein